MKKAVATVSYKSASSNVYQYTIKAVSAGSATITVKLGSIKKTIKVTVKEAPAPEVKYAQTTTGLNLRKGPDTSYEIITTLPSGTILTVLEEAKADWVKGADSERIYRICQYGLYPLCFGKFR